jgi:hypothetical protein
VSSWRCLRFGGGGGLQQMEPTDDMVVLVVGGGSLLKFAQIYLSFNIDFFPENKKTPHMFKKMK